MPLRHTNRHDPWRGCTACHDARIMMPLSIEAAGLACLWKILALTAVEVEVRSAAGSVSALGRAPFEWNGRHARQAHTFRHSVRYKGACPGVSVADVACHTHACMAHGLMDGCCCWTPLASRQEVEECDAPALVHGVPG